MKLNKSIVAEAKMDNFKGGEGCLIANIHNEGGKKFLVNATLPSGSTIGLHTHDDSSETIYILSGNAYALCDGKKEELTKGDVHYCPKGSNHTLINNSGEDLVFFALVVKE